MCAHSKDPGYRRSSSSASIKKKKKSGTKVLTYQAQDMSLTGLYSGPVGKGLTMLRYAHIQPYPKI